jgi:hypothetical protein
MFNEDQLIDLNDKIAAVTSQWIKETGQEVEWDLVPHWNEEEGILEYKLDLFL